MLSLGLLALIFLRPVDWESPEQKEYFKLTLSAIESHEFQFSAGKQWLAGWDAQNVTPSSPVSLVGFRPRGHYEFVLDSSFVKSIVISNGQQNLALLAYQLMIIHPALSKAIRDEVKEKALPIDQLYFTASHTHSGYGGHMKGLLSKVMYGGYDSSIVQLIVDKTITALQNSLQNMDSTRLVYQKIEAGDLVRNRFISDDPVDPYLRQLCLHNFNGKSALLFSYSAHATTLSSRFMGLSGDYPHFLELELQNKLNYDMAMYVAGAVGSHSPIIPDKDEHTTAHYAAKLAKKFQPQIAGSGLQLDSAYMVLGSIPIALPEPHFRITDNFRISPWLFNQVIGSSSPKMDVVRLGNLLFVSSSAEVSGVFYSEWERLANQFGLELMVTTFNGDYIGYVPPDRYYHKHYRETRELNWYGPHNGKYFDTLIKSAIRKAATY